MVTVEGLSKIYNIAVKDAGIVGTLKHFWHRQYRVIAAVKDISFAIASGDYINAQLLGSPDNFMIGNVINSRFFRVVDYPTAASLSFILMASILVLIVIYIRRAGTDELV